MRVSALFVSLLFLARLADGQVRPKGISPPPQSPQQADNTPPKKPGKVEGFVSSTVTGGPVKKATVTLRNLMEHFAYAAASDGSGHFLFENVQPGTYQVAADGSGFMAQPPGSRNVLAVPPFTVAEEQEVRDVAVKLIPLGIISGHVLDGDGDPLARANIQALRYVYQQGRKQLQPAGWASANDLGEFQMIDLAPGRYYLRATAQPRTPHLPPRTRMAGPEMAYAPLFYPNAPDISQAKASQLEAGAHITDIDFRLAEAAAYHIRGKLIDGQTGQPAHNAFVQVQTPGASFMSNGGSQVQQDGSFDIKGLVNGSYVVIGQLQQSTPLTARQPVNVRDQDVDGLVLAPARGRDLSGTVTMEGTAPDSWKSVRVMLEPVDPMAGRYSNAVIDSDGTFALKDVAAGVYWLKAFAQIPGKYLKSMRLGDHEVAGGQVDLSQPSDAKIDLVFGSDVGQLQGGVQGRGGEPAVGALVTLAPKEDGRVDLFKVATTDQSGNYKFQDVAPGDYHVFAWQEIDVNMAQSPDFRKPFESKGVAAGITPSGQASIPLKLITTEEVEAEKSKMP